MRLERQVFDSRLARRIFGLFMTASFVPLLALAFILLREVSQALQEQAFEQLENTTRTYGQFTFDRLVTVAEEIDDPATFATRTAPTAAIDAGLLVVDGRQQALFGDWSAQPPAIAVGETRPTLAVVPVGTDGGPDVILGRRRGGEAAYARLAPEYLPSTVLDSGMEACVLTALAAPLRCSTPLPSETTAAIYAARRSKVSGRLTWANEQGEWLATYWQLFLPSRFEAEPWTIVVSQPREAALATLTVFNRIVPQAAVVTLVLIVLLAIAQIRRTLKPLNELLGATKRIAAQDFSHPVEIDPRTEFGALGGALNGMAEQLDRQFGALRALADIDRSILQTTDLEPVLDTLFERLHKLVPDGHHLVLVIDGDNPEHGHVYRSYRARRAECERIKVTVQLREWLAAVGADCTTDVARLDALGLAARTEGAARTAYVVPIKAGEMPTGALVTTDADPAERERASMRELVARVAVAISAGKREAELFRRAHFDMLTDLPNRELLHDRLRQAVAQAQREEQPLAVLFVDLDGFKEINDRFGHRSGDELLKDTALRLTGVLRHGDTVARLGGDEYAIVLPQVHNALEAETVAIKAIETLRRPFVVDGQEAYVSASIGIAMFPEDGQTATELLRRADMAMYTAKDSGKSCYSFFAEEMDRRLQERHSLHYDLRGALAAGEFSLAYQPQIDLRSGKFVSAEALLRWRHPTRGQVSPALFIPILEETGLIKEVGAWVLENALADFARWQRAGLPFERVAVNVSTRQLLDRGFADQLAQAVADAGLVGHRLEIELTEASLVDDFRTANDVLSQLRARGIRIALDDFGTGYSSLAYLNELAFDTLKIDRAFVVNLPAEKSVAIVKAIVAVADALDKHVVAEGIESQLQYGQLTALGCDLGQGYLIAKAVSAQELVVWAAAQSGAAGGEPRRAGRRV